MNNIYLEPAGLIRRFIAFLIDGFAIIGFAFLIFLVFCFVVFTGDSFDFGFVQKAFFIAAIPFALVQPLYFTYFPSSFRQATQGQRSMNIYVVRLNQAKIGAGFAFVRFLVWILPPIIIETAFTVIDINLDELTLETISFIFFISWYIIPPVISDKNQGIHDILLKTVVVKGKLAKVN